MGIKKQLIMKPHFVPDQAGELIVTGHNKAEMTLRHHQPEEVFVRFKEHHHHHTIPCNPQQYDDLEWELHYRHSHYILVIKWNVSDTRDIVWAVRY